MPRTPAVNKVRVRSKPKKDTHTTKIPPHIKQIPPHSKQTEAASSQQPAAAAKTPKPLLQHRLRPNMPHELAQARSLLWTMRK